jgi:uncharacterized membrane protein YphA (DoxX/SURF4 family)
VDAPVLLALAFLGAGAAKLVQPYDALAAQTAWVSDVPEALVRFIGAAEVLGALGLVLPAATRVLPWLTPLAAAGLALDMLLATLFHLARGEFGNAVLPLVLGLLAAFVAYGRCSIRPRPRPRRTGPGVTRAAKSGAATPSCDGGNQGDERATALPRTAPDAPDRVAGAAAPAHELEEVADRTQRREMVRRRPR